MKRLLLSTVIIGFAATSGAYAQVGSINSATTAHVFNDMPGATLSVVNAYPGAISLGESGVTRVASGGLNRDVWYFSNNGGVSPYQFQNNDYFHASFGLTLTGSGTPNIDLEAGWLFSNPSGSIGGDLQSIVKADGEVVQFGGPSYFGFSPANGGTSVPNYTLGATYTLGLNYVLDPNTGRNAFQYSVNGVFATSSPGNTYFDLAAGAGPNGSPLGGYLQIQNDPNNPSNNGSALFDTISISPSTVPEPATFSLLGLGMLALLYRRRR